jgi:hypothetical protein
MEMRNVARPPVPNLRLNLNMPISKRVKELHRDSMKKGCLISIIGIPIFCMIGFRIMIWDLNRVKSWGVEVESVDWLPKQASNITFVSGGAFKFAEFDIDLGSITKWCDSIQKPLKPVTSGQTASVYQVHWYLKRFGIPNHASLNNSSTNEPIVKSFKKGDLFYDYRFSNGGGYTIGYDMSNERGYYHYTRN